MIRTNKPNVEVSWQVTARRNDPYMRAHPFNAEPAKTGAEQGKYVTPALYGQAGLARGRRTARRLARQIGQPAQHRDDQASEVGTGAASARTGKAVEPTGRPLQTSSAKGSRDRFSRGPSA